MDIHNFCGELLRTGSRSRINILRAAAVVRAAVSVGKTIGAPAPHVAPRRQVLIVVGSLILYEHLTKAVG
jgi:hypothetical protein